MRKKGKLTIIIRIKNPWGSEDIMDKFIEKKVLPLKRKYHYADIRVEIE